MRPFKDVIALTRKVAEDNPDTVEGCRYYNGVDPVCIFGHVLQKVGVFPLIEGLTGFADNDDENGYRQGDLLTREHAYFAREGQFVYELPWDKAGFELPNSLEIQWVTEVQQSQDHDNCWRDAVAEADRTIGAL